MKKSAAWKPITNDLWGGLACAARFKYKSVKLHRTVFLGKCGERNLEKILVAYKHGRQGGAKPRKFMAVLYMNVFVNYFIKYLDRNKIFKII